MNEPARYTPDIPEPEARPDCFYRVLYFTPMGMFFQGPRSLVKSPEAAQKFLFRRGDGHEIDLMMERIRDVMFLNVQGIMQVRIILAE